MLRHGTAQAGKQTAAGIGQIAGAILGSIVGGTWGQVISQGTQFGIGTYFLKFSREYEKEADLQGAQIMARAGYDPRDMANMFKTIEKQGGSGGPQWLSDHPNPGNRYEYINQEAQALRVLNPIRDSRAEMRRGTAEHFRRAAEDVLRKAGKVLPDSIDRWLPRPLTSLGTDGFGRSDTRASLRNFFEVDYRYIVVATLAALARDGRIPSSVVQQAIKTHGIDPEKPNPATS